MTTDGKYLTVAEFKSYAYDSNTALSNNDTLISQSILRAEMEVDAYCGCGWDQQTYVSVQPMTVFVDVNGWMNLIAAERGPVTEVTAVKVRTPFMSSWQDVIWVTDDIILPSSSDLTRPIPDCWRVQIMPSSPVLNSISTGDIFAKWSYKGGFSTIPASLKGIVARLAYWITKLREAPMGKVTILEMGIVEAPLSIPRDIQADLNLWRRVIA